MCLSCTHVNYEILPKSKIWTVISIAWPMQFNGVSISTKLLPPNFILIAIQDLRTLLVQLLSLRPLTDTKDVLIFCNKLLDSWWISAVPRSPSIMYKTEFTHTNPTSNVIKLFSDLPPGLIIMAKLTPAAMTEPVIITGIITSCWTALQSCATSCILRYSTHFSWSRDFI